MKIIIGLVGEIASGKDTIAEYLKEKYHSQTVSFSQPLRDILDRLYLPQTRENLAYLGVDLRERFGQTVLAQTIAKEVEASPAPICCLPNVRLQSDIAFLKDLPGFVLVKIITEEKIRYDRLTKRRQNTDDAAKTWEQFLADSQLPTETAIRETAKAANYELNNNGTFDDLYQQIDELIKNLQNE